MLSFPVEIDEAPTVVNRLAYRWCFGIRPSDQPKPLPTQRGIKRHTKAKVRGTPRAAYWSSEPASIRIQSAGDLQISIDPKALAWLKFKGLVAQWHAERGATSSITAMAMCDAYQKIIGMGPDVVPLIIAQLRSEGAEPDQWFWALQVLTGIDPVADEDRGDFVKMAQSWINWAENAEHAW